MSSGEVPTARSVLVPPISTAPSTVTAGLYADDEPQIEEVEIALEPVVVIKDNVARICQPAKIGEAIPDRLPFAVLVASPLYLIGRSGDAPDKRIFYSNSHPVPGGFALSDRLWNGVFHP
jgi:hypothetical protein